MGTDTGGNVSYTESLCKHNQLLFSFPGKAIVTAVAREIGTVLSITCAVESSFKTLVYRDELVNIW